MKDFWDYDAQAQLLYLYTQIYMFLHFQVGQSSWFA